MTSPVFQTAVESLDKFTKDFEYPVNETTGFRGKMKGKKEKRKMRRRIHWKGSGSLIGKMRKLYLWKRKMVNWGSFLFSSLILFFSHHIGRRDGDGGSFLWMFMLISFLSKS
jgi:hypothetical protein